MMFRLPPVVPLWPLYPEPERGRLEVIYRAEHAAYCNEMDRRFKGDIIALTIGAFISGLLALGAFLLH